MKKIIVANDDTNVLATPGGETDRIQPFMLDASQLRGRILRSHVAIDRILAAHAYPDPVERLLAEALCHTALLAGMLKFDGLFTLQIKCEGPVRLIVCDMTNDGVLRGMASFDADAVAALGDDADFLTLTVRGYMAFTVDQADSDERTQGITELVGASLTEAVQHYFKQSEQIRTGFVTQMRRSDEGNWTVAALMLQQLGLEGGNADRVEADAVEENWRRSMMLLGTLKENELLDSGLPLNGILYRLFHEESPRVFDPIDLARGCRCSIDKIRVVIDSLSPEERADAATDGVIPVTCEFCNTTYEFPAIIAATANEPDETIQ